MLILTHQTTVTGQQSILINGSWINTHLIK